MKTLQYLTRHCYEQDSFAAREQVVIEPVYLVMGNYAARWLTERRTADQLQRTRAHDKLPLSKLYQLGCDHVQIRTAFGGLYSYPEAWLDHPLNIAAMLLRRGLHQRAVAAVKEYETMREAGNLKIKGKLEKDNPFGNGFFPQHINNSPWMAMPTCPVSARDHGIDKLSFDRSFDHVGFAGWFKVSTLASLFEDASSIHNVVMMQRVVQVLGDDLRHATTRSTVKFVRKELRSARTSYHDVAVALRAADAQGRRSAMNSAEGAATACWALLPDASEEEMSRGLQQIARNSEGSRNEALQALGRTPFAEELLSIRSKGIVDVLYMMPWELLEPTASDPEQATRLSGRMAKYLKTRDIDTIKSLLIDHKDRLAPLKLPPPLVHGSVPSPETTRWAEVAHDVEYCREYNEEVRSRLLDIADGDQEVATLFALCAKRSANQWTVQRLLTPSIMELIEQHPGFSQLLERPDDYLAIFADPNKIQ